MSMSRELARQGLRGALETRRRVKVAKFEPICTYDAAENLGVEVKFCSGESFGGMYVKNSRTILVPAMRPAGRQAFTCAHELGHSYFGHGNRLEVFDEMESTSDDDPEERLANFFASYFLMPPWAVTRAFERRDAEPGACSPIEFYTVACQLGVGYSTLVYHLRWSLETISPRRAEELLQIAPREIRRRVLGCDYAGHLIIADTAWEKVAVDLQVSDLAILPRNVAVGEGGTALVGENELGTIIEARVPGISRAEIADKTWSCFIRVSRKHFVGRSIYRHLEDPDVDDDASPDL